MPKAKTGRGARKLTAVREPFTKSQLLSSISESTGLVKKEVAAVLDALGVVINRHLVPLGAGKFTVPGLMKIKTVRKPATTARKGINPFTGEATIFKAKPARTMVKIQPLKSLKDMVK